MSRLARSRLGRRPDAGDRGRAAPCLTGVVDDVTPLEVAGWVRLPTGSPPALVELSLGDLVVTRTYTVAQRRADVRRPRPAAQRRAERAWSNGRFVGPRPLRHTGAGEVHTFSFRLEELWPYARRSTRIRVHVDGRPLPIAGHGMYMSPPVDGPHSPRELRTLIENGYVLNQRGQLMLDKTLDVGWQRGVASLYQRLRAVLAAEHGLDLFVIYGTLLGAVREGGVIGHDDDFDTGYLSSCHDGPAAVDELEQVALTLVRHGFAVEALPTHLAVADPETSSKVDVGHLYFDARGEIAFPFGVAGTSSYTTHDWEGLAPTTFLGEQVLMPRSPERLLTHIYGDDWERPRPGFRWSRSRTRAAAEARLSPSRRARVHWASTLRRDPPPEGWTLPRLVLQRGDLPRSVVDVACADGPEACALGLAGRRVLGLDLAPACVERARAHAEDLGLGETVRFEVCDPRDRASLRRHVDDRRRASGGSITLCTRYFLLAEPDPEHDELLRTLAELVHPGDAFVVEVRPVVDRWIKDAKGRPLQPESDAEALRRRLAVDVGLALEYLTGERGLAAHETGGEVLCRLLATRS